MKPHGLHLRVQLRARRKRLICFTHREIMSPLCTCRQKSFWCFWISFRGVSPPWQSKVWPVFAQNGSFKILKYSRKKASPLFNLCNPEHDCRSCLSPQKCLRPEQNYRKLLVVPKQISQGGVLVLIFARAFFKSFNRSRAEANLTRMFLYRNATICYGFHSISYFKLHRLKSWICKNWAMESTIFKKNNHVL
jgi:hypothetical protein